MEYKFKYSILRKQESLIVYHGESKIIDIIYKDKSCLLELLYHEYVDIDGGLKGFVLSFLHCYVEYLETNRLEKIRDFLLIASSHKVHMGYIPKDDMLEMSFETSDIKCLIYFVILQTVNKKFNIRMCDNCGRYMRKKWR